MPELRQLRCEKSLSDVDDLLFAYIDSVDSTRGRRFVTIFANPTWQFYNRTGEVAPKHNRSFQSTDMTPS